MKIKPSYSDIANSYQLWTEYADPLGYDSELSFNGQTIDEKISFLVACFGTEMNTEI